MYLSPLAWLPDHILLLRAALTLPHKPRCDAFRDIAVITGRSLKAIQTRAKRIQDEDKIAAAWSTHGYYARTIMVPERSCDRPARAA